MLDEFYFPASTDTLFLHLPLPASAQTNATRFRLWQPYNSGERAFCLVALSHPLSASSPRLLLSTQVSNSLLHVMPLRQEGGGVGDR